jgi:hypothetical protein
METRKKTICKFFMPLLILVILISIAGNRVNAQSMGISNSAITADASSILELRTTTKGLLIPRMTTTERDAISSPATGLMVYNTTTSKFNFYNGSSWLVLFAGSTGVNSITGTTNRITIGGTAADPTIDISSSYAGQSSITTLGTIGIGTWNGSTIGLAYGGTGQTTQQAAINALTGTQTSGTFLRSNGTNASLSAIQVADVPALNQNTTGSAATLTTSRNIYGNAFNGSADLTQIIASTYGGTGNGFTKFSGPATSEKTFTLPNASATILTTDAAVTVAQGGTGAGTLASNGVLYGNGTGAIQALPVNSSGTVQYLSQVSSGAPTWVTPTNGTVTSVSGTTNRITVATGTTTPVIDISSSYVGQSSITTLGTIGAGTWNGTLIGTTYGGTGTSTTFTQGSIVFAGASGNYNQNNSKLAWDNTNFRLGIGTAVPNTAIQVGPLGAGTDNILIGGTSSAGFMLNTQGTGDLGTFYSEASNIVGIGFSPTITVPSRSVFKVNKTGAATFGTSVSTDDNLIIQPYTGGSNLFAGTVTSADLTAARTYTLPNASGTVAVSASGNIALSSAGDISFTGVLPVVNGGTGSSSQNWVDLTTTQTVAGAKTFSNIITGNAGINISGAAGRINESSNFATDINTGTSTGTVTIGGTGTQTISVGNGAGVKTVNLGSNNSTSSTNILSGTTSGVLSLNASAGGSVTNIGTGSTTGTVTLGNASNQINLPRLTASKPVFTDASKNLTSTGTLGVDQGGTNLTSYTTGDILYASGSTTLSKLDAVATGNALISGGTSTAPLWGKIGLTTHVSGTLPVANGGTNSTATPTNGGIVYGDGSSYQFTAAGTTGEVLKSTGAGTPTWEKAVTIVTLGSDVVNNNATPNTIADVTGLSFSVTSGVTYNFHALIIYTSAATSTGSRWSINGPASPTLLSYTTQNALTATSNTNTNANAYNLPASSNASCPFTSGNMVIIDGIINPSADGTVTVRFASEIASSAITAKAGSTITWW